MDNTPVIRCYSSEEAKVISRAISKLPFISLIIDTFMCLICFVLILTPVVNMLQESYCLQIKQRLVDSSNVSIWPPNEYLVIERTCFDDILIRMKEMAQDDHQQGPSNQRYISKTQLLTSRFFCCLVTLCLIFDRITTY